ncbi:hypothetical protein UC35_18125 [Ramlibacter tataouinensis]|uniref:Acyltransferase 3 domain-containing protein n=2 Tax=Ramlibacter tataouinensis TaxID=94132 RepID=A0A127JWW1_9BURK|nr:hypothetical protein UC35_18125 [Ramlibacter tataouinensis]
MPQSIHAGSPQTDSWVAIQILRGLAAFAVVLHHVPQYLAARAEAPPYVLESGAAGVDVFFVISGFVMHAATVGKDTQALDFFLRRLARILPIYWLISTVLFVATVAVPSAFATFTTTPAIWLKSLFFVPVFDESGYIRPLIAQGWTLHFEMTFYSVLALSLLLAKRHQSLLAALIILGLGTAVSASGVSLLNSWLQLLAPITLEFCAGVVIAHVFCQPRVLARIQGIPALPIAGVALSVASLHFFKDGISQELGYSRLAGWGAGAVLLVLGALLVEPALRHLGHLLSGFKKLGDASYSLYLIHGLLFSVAWKLAPDGLKQNAWGAAVLLATFPLVAAWPFHKFIEKPLNRHALRLMLRSVRRPSWTGKRNETTPKANDRIPG